jgi:hypothetical protein
LAENVVEGLSGSGPGDIKLFFFIIIIFLLCWVGVHCSIYKGSYNVSNISFLNLPLPLLSFIPSPLIPGSFYSYIFTFIYMCIHYLHGIHLPILSLSSPPFHQCQLTLLSRTCSILLFSNFVEEKT